MVFVPSECYFGMRVLYPCICCYNHWWVIGSMQSDIMVNGSTLCVIQKNLISELFIVLKLKVKLSWRTEHPRENIFRWKIYIWKCLVFDANQPHGRSKFVQTVVMNWQILLNQQRSMRIVSMLKILCQLNRLKARCNWLTMCGTKVKIVEVVAVHWIISIIWNFLEQKGRTDQILEPETIIALDRLSNFWS